MDDAAALLDDFASMAIHELGGPVLALGLHVELMTGKLKKLPQGPERDALLEYVQRQRHVIAELRATLAMLSRATRLSSGRESLDIADVDLVPLARAVVAEASGELVDAGCEVTIDAPDSVVSRADPSQLQVVVKNLLANAVKSGRGKPIAVGLQAAEHGVRVVVEDAGLPIPPEERATVFERFRRRGAGEAPKSLGLGMWIAHVLVRAHGGAIRVDESKLGGAAFVVELPRR